ncbi:MAG: DPP IV N-terminal domain-containing protein [Longimicrobiales bacterium]
MPTAISARSWIRRVVGLLAAVLLIPVASPATAQQHIEHANWALADKFKGDVIDSIIHSTSVQPRFINETDSLWYYWRDQAGARFMFVVPKTNTKRPLFDHQKLAAQLSAGRKPYDAHTLPFTSIAFNDDGQSFSFIADSVKYEWTLETETLQELRRATRQDYRELGGGGRGGRGGRGGGGGGGGQDFRNWSPDSTAFVFAREHNLYLVEVPARADTTVQGDTSQISTDGVEHYSFGARDTTDNDDDDDEEGGQGGGGRNRDPRVRANVTWSPDSRAFVISRNDRRETAELYLVDVLNEPRPRLVSYRYAMPGEEKVDQQSLWRFRRGETGVAEVAVDRWQDQRLYDTHWTTGSDKVRLIRRDRLQRHLELIEVDLASGAISPILSESTENAFLERQGVRYVKAGGDLIWWSERTGWGHLYLYDHNGTFKKPLTSGEWRVEDVVEVDSVRRVLWFAAVGREPGENVYYRHLYRMNIDGPGNIALLDEGEAEHNSDLTPSHRFIVDNHSRIDSPPAAVLRNETGAVMMELEKVDVAPIVTMGWKPPEPFMVKAADGVTDIYGNMWKPFDFDSTKSYPIIAHVYPGPQTEQVSLTFNAGGTQQQLAQLGFIVIQIGNRGGNPKRSNAYHSYGYYNLRDYGLADKKAGIEQLAARHPWIDVNRVGIYGHSGGGFMTAAALLLPPYNDFFRVGVSSAGNHDNNVYNQNWSEQHHGLREVADTTRRRTTTTQGNGQRRGDDGAAQANEQQEQDTVLDIHVPANHELAENLKGKLLLVHGDMDNNVHPAGTVRLVNALIKANKRFDFMIMPGKPHGFGDMQPYFTRMMWEYFAEHLLDDYYRDGATMR